MPNPAFWRNKRVFVTGHTGFKGGWLTLWLAMLGAKVTGYALPPNTQPSFFEAIGLERHLTTHHLDNVNNYATLDAALTAASPEIILHLAAQPLVRRSYAEPLEARLLKLDCSKSMSLLAWKPQWGLEQALAHTCDWCSNFSAKRSMDEISQSQITQYSNH